jgi:hypothetical protein
MPLRCWIASPMTTSRTCKKICAASMNSSAPERPFLLKRSRLGFVAGVQRRSSLLRSPARSDDSIHGCGRFGRGPSSPFSRRQRCRRNHPRDACNLDEIGIGRAHAGARPKDEITFDSRSGSSFWQVGLRRPVYHSGYGWRSDRASHLAWAREKVISAELVGMRFLRFSRGKLTVQQHACRYIRADAHDVHNARIGRSIHVA